MNLKHGLNRVDITERKVSRPARLLLGAALAMPLAFHADASWAQAAETSSPAPAQDNAPDNQIVVTAQFRQQNLQQTPIAITALTGAQLEARGRRASSMWRTRRPT